MPIYTLRVKKDELEPMRYGKPLPGMPAPKEPMIAEI